MCNENYLVALFLYIFIAPSLTAIFFEFYNDDTVWQNRILYGLFLPITLLAAPFIIYHKQNEKIEAAQIAMYRKGEDIEKLKRDVAGFKNKVYELETRLTGDKAAVAHLENLLRQVMNERKKK